MVILEIYLHVLNWIIAYERNLGSDSDSDARFAREMHRLSQLMDRDIGRRTEYTASVPGAMTWRCGDWRCGVVLLSYCRVSNQMIKLLLSD